VRWYCSYAQGYPNIEEMMTTRGLRIDLSTLADIELVAMFKKGQMKKNMIGSLSPADQFHALAA